MRLRTSLAVVALLGIIGTLATLGIVPSVSAAYRVTVSGEYPVWIGGDSLTFGRSATTYNASYRAIFMGHLVHLGGSGAHVWLQYEPADRTQYGPVWHSGWLVHDLLLAEEANPPLPNTQIALVEIGTNDSINGTDLATFTSDYQQLVANLRAAAPGVEIICGTAWDSSSRAQPYDAAIIAACGKTIPLTWAYGQSSFHGPAGLSESWLGGYTTDTFHPNNAGDSWMATAFEGQL